MLKETELRLGNLIEVSCPHSELKQFKEKTIEKCNIHHLEDIDNENISWMYEPIVITQDLLLKFGFKTQQDDFLYKVLKRKGTRLEINMKQKLICLTHKSFPMDVVHLPYIKYVHKLQNLWYSLTDEELELSL